MRALSIFIIVALLLGAIAMPAIAQESTPEPVPTEPVEPPVEEPEPPVEDELPEIPVPPIDVAGGLLLGVVIQVLIGLLDSPVVTGLVGILKRWRLLDAVSSQTLQLVVAGAFAVLWWVLSALGYETEFRTAYEFLLGFIPLVAGLLFRQLGSAALYHAARDQNVAVFGYQRPLDRTLQAQG